MRHDAFADEDIVERPFLQQDAALLCILSLGTSAEVVSVNDLAVSTVTAL